MPGKMLYCSVTGRCFHTEYEVRCIKLKLLQDKDLFC